ncbi:MAG: SDR family NAD(P)-dependent oxidoreductase [Gammaproteobacteria bacterium]|nr:SDR family NAD(P)-dependent oxidoreductase [Gammaproteobacteria bacterium]
MANVLITGTSTGIGRETALHLARNGYTVFASMRTPDRNPELADTAAAENLPVTVLQQDVTDGDSNQAAVDRVVDNVGQIDVLINNAGLGAAAVTEEMAMSELRQLFETNFFGAVDLTKRVIPQMRERRGGAIVNVTSVAGRMSVSPQIAYSSSKVALDVVTEMWAQELERFGVRVAAIEPGIIVTPILEKFRSAGSGNEVCAALRAHDALLRGRHPCGHQAPRSWPGRSRTPSKLIVRSFDIVGVDAVGIMQMRNSMSDEEWVAFFTEEMPLEKWKQKAAALSGLPL